jgi:hypothetical protein
MLPEVTVINRVGGVQRSDQPYSSPRYSRCSISKEVLLQQLKSGTAALQAAAFSGHGSTPELLLQQRGKQAGLSPAGPDESFAGRTEALSQAGGNCPATACTQCSSEDPTCAEAYAVSAGSGIAERGSSSSSSRQLAVDVLVPTARLDLELLQGIADAVL